MPENTEKRRVGKYSDMVRLNVWIMAAQDRQLAQFCELTGKSKNEAIREVLQSGLGLLRTNGVL